MNKNKVITISIVTSVIATALLIYIIYFNVNKIEPLYSPDLQPYVSAIFNALSAISLLFAVYWIRRKEKVKHIFFINLAMLFSALFLINYIFYHMSVGHVKFENQFYRPLYLGILITHLLCSITVLPMIFTTYLLGIFNHLNTHRKLAKYTFFMWEYVSITGVIIVLMLKNLN